MNVSDPITNWYIYTCIYIYVNLSGAAYVFSSAMANSNNQWSQVAKLVASDGAPDDIFGWSISIYNNTIAVGASGDKSSTGNNIKP